jgi:predicted small lipoprotein YifL
MSAALLVLASLAGCGEKDPVLPGADGTATSSASPTASATASASPTAAAPPGPTALPASCAALVSAADPAQFGSVPLNDPVFVPQGPSGVVTPSTPPANANGRQVMRAIHELWCLWANPSSDVTHLSVEVGHYDAANAAALMAALQSQGYDCTDADGGRLCAITTPNTKYPVDDNFTYLSRGDVMILVDQTNFPTNGLMASMVSVIWP